MDLLFSTLHINSPFYKFPILFSILHIYLFIYKFIYLLITYFPFPQHPRLFSQTNLFVFSYIYISVCIFTSLGKDGWLMCHLGVNFLPVGCSFEGDGLSELSIFLDGPPLAPEHLWGFVNKQSLLSFTRTFCREYTSM